MVYFYKKELDIMRKIDIKRLFKIVLISLLVLIMYIEIIPLLLSVIPIKNDSLNMLIKFTALAVITALYFRKVLDNSIVKLKSIH